MELIWTLLCIYALWPLYVFAMAILKAKVEGKMSLLTWCLAFPQQHEITFSQRLERLVRADNWRAPVARWIAEKLLDPYDPSGKHIK